MFGQGCIGSVRLRMQKTSFVTISAESCAGKDFVSCIVSEIQHYRFTVLSGRYSVCRYWSDSYSCTIAERSCSAWRGMQTATHDQVSKLFQALLADAGWDDVKEEDKWWDTDAPGPGWGHRRPDITAMHPSTGVKHVFDVMIRWATTQTAGREAGAGAA